ncbi:hypothetical protein IIA15_01045 [candidate division TA06 bacterium]|nr:hypothetical protein [candidate division TA06 bacterium]
MNIPFTKWQITFERGDYPKIWVRKDKWNTVLKHYELDSKYPNTRPSLDPYQATGDEVLIPPTPLPIPVLFEIHEVSDALRITTQALKREIFRHGGEILDRFAVKCKECGSEYSSEIDQCDDCGKKNFRKPDRKQKKILQHWVNKVNDNKQSLLGLAEEINDDIEIVDDAYMVAIKEYTWGPDNQLYDERLIEVVRAHPQYMRIIADKTGRPGYNVQGKAVFFCLEHRDKTHQNLLICPRCDRPLFRAHFRAEKYEGGFIYYGENEVNHESKYRPSLVYGGSPIVAIWMKIITLFNMDNYIKNYYSKQRPPRGLLFVRTSNMDSLEKAWNWMLDMFKKNPHQIPPITVESPQGGGNGKFVEFIDFMRTLDEMQYIESRNEYRKTIGAIYGVMPLYQGDVGASGGLNNESQQISVTSKAVYYGQKIYNDGFWPWFLGLIKVTDFLFVLKPNESADEKSREELFGMKADNAIKMQGMGFEITLNEDRDFEYGPLDEPVEAPSPFGPEGGLGGPMPGTFPGPGNIPEEVTQPTPEEDSGPEIPPQGEVDVDKGITVTGPRTLKRAIEVLSAMRVPFKLNEEVIELQDPEAHLSTVAYVFEQEGILFEAKPYEDKVQIALPEKAPEQEPVEKGNTYNTYNLIDPNDIVDLLKGVVRLKPGESAPPGVAVQVGPRGGKFYFTGTRGQEEKPTGEPSVPGELDGRLRKIQEAFEKARVGVVEQLNGIFPPRNIQSRLKTTNSIHNKAKLAGIEPEDLNDIAGTRVILPDDNAVKSAADKVREQFEVVEEDNFMDDPRGGYYNAIHFQLIKDGKKVELQLKSKRSLARANLAHDFIYKNGHLKDQDVNTIREYLTQSAEHDMGKREEPPECPEIIRRIAECI